MLYILFKKKGKRRRISLKKKEKKMQAEKQTNFQLA